MPINYMRRVPRKGAIKKHKADFLKIGKEVFGFSKEINYD
jgi:hypothetical protein